MSKIYEVRSESRGDKKTHHWGVKNSKPEAEALIVEKTTGDQMEWAEKVSFSLVDRRD